jgi:cytochrome b6-f complex iron-sulfur subunit
MDGARDDGESVDRRGFLNTLLVGAVSLLVAFGAYITGRYLWPPRVGGGSGGGGRVEAGTEDEFPVGAGKKVIYRDKPVWVIHAPFGFVALSAVCTHLGCIVEYDPQKEIWCPCHAAFFDLRGNVKSGPAPSPLPSYPVGVVGGKVLVGEV